MFKVNENFNDLKDNYLFSTIAKKVNEFQNNNPDAKIIKLGIGDVTRPLTNEVITAMHNATDEMKDVNTFKGYGPEQGYKFLTDKIKKYDYEKLGVNIDNDEIFVSDGAKCDTGNIGDILGADNIVGITNPVYPVYLDTNIMAGRKNIVFLPCTSENNFVPQLPTEKVDIIYLCLPNNPTGTTLTKDELKVWVDYALQNKSLILFDAAYEAFISEDNVPHSIYEIEGAKQVAIEFKSFSKKAGFTGVRCAYTVVPKQLKGYTKDGQEISLNKLWNRRHTTKFNGVSYIVQKAAESIYSEKGQQELQQNIDYYMNNAKCIKHTLDEMGIENYGGINAPYVWLKIPNNISSWEFFDILLEKANVVGTPGVGFGDNGEGYFRLTAFNTYENTKEAMERINKLEF